MEKNFYDLITSPIESDDAIWKIIDIYANMKTDSGTRKIEDKTDMYSRIIDLGRKGKLNSDSYFENYYRETAYPNMDRLFKNFKLQGPEFINKYDNEYKRLENNGVDKEKLDAIFKFYPLRRFKEIFDKFDSYYDFLRYYTQKGYNDEELIKYSYSSLYSEEYREQIKEELKKRYSEEEIELSEIYNVFKRKMEVSFTALINDSMGFHVNQERQSPITTGKNFDNNIKIYLNAEENTYKLARLFQEECERQGLDYYYKVARGNMESEYARTDKMCIYSPYKNVSNYINIIEKIKSEHPEIVFSAPPLSCGVINGYIGIGQDKKGNTNNQLVSEIYFNTLNELFGKMPREDIEDYVKNNPQYIDIIRNNMKAKGKKLGTDEKLCVKEDEVENIKKINIKTTEKAKTTEPVNINPQPVNVNPQPVNTNSQPVNTNPQPVNVNPQPVNNNTSSRDIDIIDFQDLINGRVSQEELSRLSSKPQPELEDLGKITIKQDDIDVWNNLIDEYDKSKKGISFADDDTYEVEKEKIVSRSRNRDEELIDMLSNIDEDEVDFTPKKVV